MIKIKQPFCFSEIGRKDNQEDSLFPLKASTDTRVFVLCDGMGGHARGEVASRTVADALGEFLTSQIESGNEITPELFNEGLSLAYKALDAIDGDDALKPGTTMTCLCINKNNCLVAHIGDSRIYLVRPSLYKVKGANYGIIFQTEDHSLVNQLLKVGEITPEEAANFPQRNVITRAMQPHLENPFKADIFIVNDVRRGDYFFMCTDGVLEQISNRHLGAILANNILDDTSKFSTIKTVCDGKTHDNYSCWLIPVADVTFTAPSPKVAAEGAVAENDEQTDVLEKPEENAEVIDDVKEVTENVKDPEETEPLNVVETVDDEPEDFSISQDEEATAPQDEEITAPVLESSESEEEEESSSKNTSRTLYWADLIIAMIFPIILVILGLEIQRHNRVAEPQVKAVANKPQEVQNPVVPDSNANFIPIPVITDDNEAVAATTGSSGSGRSYSYGSSGSSYVDGNSYITYYNEYDNEPALEAPTEPNPEPETPVAQETPPATNTTTASAQNPQQQNSNPAVSKFTPGKSTAPPRKKKTDINPNLE